MPTLQYLADRLYEDNEIQYVYNESQKMATKEQITVSGKYIYTKLEEYPYEFKIDENLRLAAIDGIEIADNKINTDDFVSKEEYNKLKDEYDTKLENLEEKLNAKIDAQVNEKLSSYQKLRSDEYEEVPFVSDTIYTAPCDGYYCLSSRNSSVESFFVTYVSHYSVFGTLISSTPSPSYSHGLSGCEIYMKKGEYIQFYKQNTDIRYSRFFYAEGSKP